MNPRPRQTPLSDFEKRLQAAMQIKGIASFSELARQLEWPLRTLNNLRYGVSEPLVEKAIALAGALDVPVEWLFAGKGEGPTIPKRPRK